jgi:hypothetical protein
MKHILDFIPNFCPNCGTEQKLSNKAVENDFLVGASFTCQCGVCYQYVPTNAIIEVADKHGDAGMYWRRELTHADKRKRM